MKGLQTYIQHKRYNEPFQNYRYKRLRILTQDQTLRTHFKKFPGSPEVPNPYGYANFKKLENFFFVFASKN